jgi:integrase
MPVYKYTTPKGKPYYRVVVYSAKLKKNLTKSFDKKGEADLHEANLKINISNNNNYNPNAFKKIMFVSVLEKISFTDRENTVKNNLIQYYKNINFVDIDRTSIQDWVDAQLATGITPGAVKRYFNTVRMIFREANLHQNLPIPNNLFKRIIFIKDKKNKGNDKDERSNLDDSRDRTINETEILYIVKSLEKKVRNNQLFKALFIFLLETGCRCGEALKLKKNNILLEENDIWIPKEITKTANGRHIPITSTNYANLKYLLSLKGSEYLFLEEWKNSGAVSHRWRKTVERAIELYWEDCAKIGSKIDENFLVNLRVHDLRHSYISKLFKKTEMSVIEIANISGHSSLDMLKRYTSIRPNESRHKLW